MDRARATLALIVAALALAQDPKGPVSPLGEFSDVKANGDHANGFVLQLWTQGKVVFGIFAVYTGAPSDPPSGLLEHARYDPDSGKLSFKARVSLGVIVRAHGRQEPSRDLFQFEGVLGRGGISGWLKRSDLLNPDGPTRSAVVSLRRIKEKPLGAPASYAEWKKQADEILRARGPKW